MSARPAPAQAPAVSSWDQASGPRGNREVAGYTQHVPWAEVGGSIAAKLEAGRKELLDLGLRNSLLNYRLLKARGVAVVDEVSAQVFHVLVRQGKAMSFLPALDEGEGGPLAQPDEDGSVVAARRADTRLQTSISSSELQSRLLKTYHAARTSIEEQGVNTLFLTLGMLHWHDAKDPSQGRRAPLILIPLELERSNATERFHLRYNSDDVGGNLTLAEKLRCELSITIPVVEDVEDLAVDAYFDAAREAVRSQPNWSVQPNEIALGFFSFAKLLMFNDLAPDSWPEGMQIADHPTIRALLQDGFREPPSRFSDGDHLDKLKEPSDLNLVLDADSSQTLAILDVKDGRSMVIQGPPGTGKSQTITNLIAEAVFEGKTVLFVAEKLAALEVVKRRLDKVGLGDACLELHSHKTQKKALLQELRHTLQLGKPRRAEQAGDRKQWQETRSRLNHYAEAMNEPLGKTGVTPHVALGEVTRLQQQHGDNTLLRIDVPGMSSWGEEEYRRLERRVEELQVQLQQIGVPMQHPFWGSKRTAFPPTERETLREKLMAARTATEGVIEAARMLAELRKAQMPERRSDVPALLPMGWQIFRRWFGKDKAARSVLQQAIAEQYGLLLELAEVLDLDEELYGGERSLAERPFDEALRIIDTWSAHVWDLDTFAAFNQAAAVCRKDGLQAVVDFAEDRRSASTDLVTIFQYSRSAALLDLAYSQRGELARFNRPSHDQVLAQFRFLDERVVRYSSGAVAEAHWERLPTHNAGGQLAVLKREFEKKARHMPIRKLMASAGRPIQAIKPVFMMSPLSIANYLPPGALDFDLVLFDEASQVKPVDSFGALLRGKQAVVVGDSRQLPPTSFFDSLTKGEETDEDDVTSDIESILGLFSAQLAPERMLRWHYRSRHESLIAVSNRAFYENKLVVFPSPDAAREQTGLVYHYLAESSYDRGGTRTNQIEAEALARAVMQHAHTNPHLTLGVAAFSVSQMQAIQDQLEILRRQDPSCEKFFSDDHLYEPFFVKNLETVQGDERDVIFISVGYGRTKKGSLSLSFGPLNGNGGERRLNVLITRARMRCEVFTNLNADDIDDEGKSLGIHALKLFLKYAQTGELDLPTATEGDFDSPFEEAVGYELSLRRHKVAKQVGSAGFRIDLAVVDPDKPGRYLLGVECDGAAYHSARSARDRDRLRQTILEGLGWRIHRIWSTDWFRDRDREMERLETAIQEARAQGEPPTSPPSSPSSSPERELRVVREARDSATSAAAPTGTPYTTAHLQINPYGTELHRVYISHLAGWVRQVVEVESPVHVSEVARRIADAAGVQRIGSRVDAAFRQAYSHASSTRSVERRGDFLWLPGVTQAPVRDRSELPAPSKKLELVAPEEIEAAVKRVVQDSYGIEADQIPVAACRLLGIRRSTDDMVAHVNSAVQRLVRNGRLAQQNGYLTAPARP